MSKSNYPQNVTIPESAYAIIKSDVLLFSTDSRKQTFNGLLNTIILNYSGKSSADIDLQIKHLENFFDKHKNFDSKLRKNMIKEYLDKLIEEKLRPVHGISKKFTVSSEARAKLEAVPSLMLLYYDYYGKYLSRLYIDYASLDLNQRERIIFYDYYKKIEDSINSHSLLMIATGNIISYVRPYILTIDSSTHYNYLIGFSRLKDEKLESLHSFRISRIKSIHIVESSEGEGVLNDFEETLAKNNIISKGAAHIAFEPTEITVKMTRRGVELYATIAQNRPKVKRIRKVDEEENSYWIYEFCCSEFQAKNYFMRLGKEAVIQTPESLRLDLYNEFSSLTKLYKPINSNTNVSVKC